MNNYHIYEEVGRGQHSVVYKGRKKKSIEYVAVKSVERGRKKKFNDEVAIFQAILNDHIKSASHNEANLVGQGEMGASKQEQVITNWHSNIVRFHNWYETRNHFWIIFEYCVGGTLSQLLQADQKIPEETVKKFAYELLEGMSYLHSLGIIIGDLRPQNVLMNEYQKLKLCDFGHAKKVQELGQLPLKNSGEDRSSAHFHANQPQKGRLSTPFYLAPELLQDNGVFSYQSDFWSLGCLMIEMATGKPPFASSDYSVLLQMVKLSDTPEVASFSPQFNDLVGRLLEKNPAKRLTWDQMKKHAWWDTPLEALPAQQANGNKNYCFQKLKSQTYVFTKRLYQPQPQFEQYLVSISKPKPELPLSSSNKKSEPSPHKDIKQELEEFKKQTLAQTNQDFYKESKQSERKYSPFSSRFDKTSSFKPSSRSRSRGDQRIQVDQKAKPAAFTQRQKNNFFQEPAQQREEKPRSYNQTPQQTNSRRISPKPPQVQPNTQPAKEQFNQTQQIFQNKTLIGNMGLSMAQNNSETKPDNSNKSLKQKTIPVAKTKEIDRFDFLNDQFDFDNDELDRQGMQHEDDFALEFLEKKQSEETVQKQSETEYVFHEPLNGHGAYKTLDLIKDDTLFQHKDAVIQRKAETNELVTRTVQIGPLQSQQTERSGAKTMMSTLDSTKLHGKQTMPTQMKVPQKSIDQLLIHQSDTAVKPIVGNKEIERIVDEPLNTSYLTFTPWTSEEVVERINSTQIESHLSDVYNSIASHTTINEKISTLQYFESIIVNSNVSNSLINSAFMALLKKMLEQIKSPMIKIRVCSVVGLLIRHSTIIDNDLAEIDIASQLIETLKDSSELVRRRAIAALGEYMFYAATQLDDEMADPIWELPDDAIDIIVHSMSDAESDQTVRFYACKTLENICAQSQSTGCRFATESTLKKVLDIFMMQKEPWAAQQSNADQFNTRPVSTLSNNLAYKNQYGSTELTAQQIQEPQDAQQQFQSYLQWYEGIKISAAIAMSHICKLKPELFPIIFEKLGVGEFCDILIHGNGNHRIQQAFVFMLNLALHNIVNLDYGKISQMLLSEKKFFTALQKLLDHQHIVIRGKCIMTILLLFNLDFRWILAVQQHIRFFNELDKLLKDNYKYVQCSLLCLAEGISQILPTIFKTIASSLVEHLNGKNEELTNENQIFLNHNTSNEVADFSALVNTPLYNLQILIDLQTNPLIRSRLLSTQTIQAMGAMLDVCDVKSFRGSDQFLNGVLIFSENLSTNPQVLQILAQPIQNYLMPVLLHKLSNSTCQDVKTLNFKIYVDIMTSFLKDEKIFRVFSQPITGFSNRTASPLKTTADSFFNVDTKTVDMTDQLKEHLKTELNPLLVQILSQSVEPIPLFGLRLASTMAETVPELLFNKNTDQLIELITSFYTLETGGRLNRYTLSLVRHIVSQQSLLKIETFYSKKVVANTASIIHSMQINEQTESLEIMLDILFCLLDALNEQLKKGLEAHRQEVIKVLVRQAFGAFEDCIQLLRFAEYDANFNLIEKCTQNLILLLQLFALSKHQDMKIYFVENHFQLLLLGLNIGAQSDERTEGLDDSLEDAMNRQQQVQKKVLKCIYWALIQNDDEYKIDLSKVNKQTIIAIEKWLTDTLTGFSNQKSRLKQDGLKKVCQEVHRLLIQRMRDYE